MVPSGDPSPQLASDIRRDCPSFHRVLCASRTCTGFPLEVISTRFETPQGVNVLDIVVYLLYLLESTEIHVGRVV